MLIKYISPIKFFTPILIGLSLYNFQTCAESKNTTNISAIISKKEFLSYKDVGEFIDNAPKVTIEVPAEESDIKEYGAGVVKTITGSDCDRDGTMDDNQKCNAVYLKLWLKYQR
ncbi:hypothetical protein [Thalassotalea profundi]|uniref:Uncharacterized protein n=1 Tax=Thalassotalea profundi TaxID=2036687 RepID=A0ABQ3IWP7_9GAMM|nr:hypothetical protein [Thalassotalea profundi]GHE95728.1 hypothetical protein GCM10011501_26590 [Thalassotalea profundi]